MSNVISLNRYRRSGAREVQIVFHPYDLMTKIEFVTEEGLYLALLVPTEDAEQFEHDLEGDPGRELQTTLAFLAKRNGAND